MGFDIFMINHTKRQYDCLGTAGEGGNYNTDPKDFIIYWWHKGWRFDDDVEIGEDSAFGCYNCVEDACDVPVGDDGDPTCKCFSCQTIFNNKHKKYWINISKKEVFELYSKLKENNKFAKEHNWDLEEDDIRCGIKNIKLKCKEYKFLG